MGWGGILTFTCLVCGCGCFAAATSGGVRWDIMTFTCLVSMWILLLLLPQQERKWGNLLVHTGGTGEMWKISKGAVSTSWSTCKDGAVNLQ